MNENRPLPTFFMLIWSVYFVLYALLWMTSLYFNDNVKLLVTLLQFATMGALGIYIISRRVGIWHLLFLCLVAAVELKVQNRDLLIFILFAYAARDIDFKRFVRVDIVLRGIMLVVILGGCSLGLIRNVTGYYYHTYKEAWGFRHPNTYATFVFIIAAEVLLLAGTAVKLWHYAVIALAVLMVMPVTHSRTSLLCLLAAGLCFFLHRVFPAFMESRPVKWMLALSPTILMTVSVALTVLYIKKNPIAQRISRMLSGRIYLQSYYWRRYKVTLFGRRMADALTTEKTLDSGYIRCLLQNGLIFTIFLCLAFALVIFWAYRTRQYEIAFFSIFFILYGFMEASFLRIGFNISLLLFLKPEIWLFRKIPRRVLVLPPQLRRTKAALSKS
ncbi:MAG: hypothetical protein ACSW8H_00710 [bacterium]